MRLTLLAYGSRGDIQPYLALGTALQRAGHEVTLAAPPPFDAFISARGLGFAPLPGDPAVLMRRVFAAGARRLGPLSLARAVVKAVAPAADHLYPAVFNAARGSDAVIHSFLLTAFGHHASLELGIPDLSAMVFALFSPTHEFACPLFPPLRVGGMPGPAYNYLSHREFARVFWHINRMGMGLLRRREHDAPRLREWPFGASDPNFYPPPYREWQTPILYGISPQAIPPPADWPAYAHMTGYWFLAPDPGGAPPGALARFVEQGEPPVCVSFGSVISRDMRRVVSRVMAALASHGRRVVWIEGWGGEPAGAAVDDHPRIFRVPSAPFEWLLPRCSALVCHGGMGTVADGLRAGLPILAIPFGADQPFWARRVCALGAGAKLRPGQAEGTRLEAAVKLILEDECVRKKASELGALIRAEEGTRRAVKLIEGYLR